MLINYLHICFDDGEGMERNIKMFLFCAKLVDTS
jgi:hypothetical protein